jgi:hypothetical protein
MKRLQVLAGVVLFASLAGCGGTLSDEQRAQMKEGMKEQEIKRVTDAEILAQATEQGQRIMGIIRHSPAAADSLANAYHARIHWIEPGNKNTIELERQLIEAIVTGLSEGIVSDNVQLTGDSVLYSAPAVDTLADNTLQYRGTWNIFLSKKYIVLSLD